MSENNWDTIKVSDLVTVLTDYVSNGSFASLAENVEYQQSGYARLIRLVDYNKGFVEKDSVWVSEDAYNFLAKSKLFGDEIIISNVGEYAGKAFICPNLGYPMSLAPNSIMMKTSGNDRFYYYYFCSPKGYKQIRNIVTKSGQPKFNKTNFRELEVPNPPIEVQDAIVKVLKTIDDKIDNNNAICSNLEAMAKLLYDYWFVQFDFPDENGNPYKSSGGKMVWNYELKREIPAGWEVKRFNEVLMFQKGRMPDELLDVEDADHNTQYITINVANNGIPQYCSSKGMVPCNGQTLMVMDGAASGDVYIGYSGSLGSTLAMLPSKRNDVSDPLIYMMLKSNMPIYKRANVGSTVPHANRSFIEQMKIALPNDAKGFSIEFDKIFLKIVACKKENQQLASLRDFLLPMLMNGQVKVGA